MAIQDKERQEIIDRILALDETGRKAAYDGFLLGHEEGWWLARTDPETTVSPVEHAAKTNPFFSVQVPVGHAVVSVAYANEHGTWAAKSKVVGLTAEEVVLEFGMTKGDKVGGYNVKLYRNKTDKTPAYEHDQLVNASVIKNHGDKFTVTLEAGSLVLKLANVKSSPCTCGARKTREPCTCTNVR